MNGVIGIPKALSYYHYYPLWQTFFNQLGYQIKTSGPTNRHKLDLGIKITPSEACLPLKCYFGHVLSLIKDVDWLFVPRLVCLKKSPRIKFGCPKFIGLPDMVRALIPEANMLTLEIDLRIDKEEKSFFQVAQKLGCSKVSGKQAYQYAIDEFRHRKETNLGKNSALKDPDNKIKIGLLGHPYLLNDEYLNLNMTKKIADLEGQPISCHDLPKENIKSELGDIKSVSWFFEEDILAAAKIFHEQKDVAGMIYLLSFGCGAGSITSEIIELEICKNSTKPLLRIILDEHTGEAGFTTRLESFIDMIKFKKERLI